MLFPTPLHFLMSLELGDDRWFLLSYTLFAQGFIGTRNGSMEFLDFGFHAAETFLKPSVQLQAIYAQSLRIVHAAGSSF